MKKETKKTQTKKVKKGLKGIIIFIALAYMVGIAVNRILFEWEFWDDDADRGAVALQKDAFDDGFSTPIYLDQGWDNNDSLWFYNTSQGSGLLPFDFFLALQQHDKDEKFKANDNIRKFRYLVQKKTFNNPHALPVGFAKDEYQGQDYVGFTCAACHTTQINYQGKAIRIDGGGTMADMDGFMKSLGKSLQATLDDDVKKSTFIKEVLDLQTQFLFMNFGNYKSADEVEQDLVKYTRQVNSYNMVNHSDIAYGYARLDAFGRIYNRVAEHVIDKITLSKVLEEIVGGDATHTIMLRLSTDEDESHMVSRAIACDSKKKEFCLNDVQKRQLHEKLFTKADAPVSYPFLWDIPHHDYLQWNGIVDNSGLGPIGRNVGQVIGVFGTLDWTKKWGFDLSAYIDNQKLSTRHISYQSSIDVRNLYHVESELTNLTSPEWPEETLGKIDWQQAEKGKEIYKSHCVMCHKMIDRADPDRRVIARMSSIYNVGTDSKMAKNSVQKLGYSGLVKGNYLNTSVGKVLFEDKSPVAELLTSVTTSVVVTPDMDKNFIIRWSNWVYDLMFSFLENPVEATIKRGDYEPDTQASPYSSLLAYKARPLNGIWATAPYLHNGSVPSLHDLLLSKKKKLDPEGEYRPDYFKVGSREFDPVKVGFRTKGYDGFTFDATIEGNRNQGHEYASGKTPLADGTFLKPLNEEQRFALLEYLKTL